MRSTTTAVSSRSPRYLGMKRPSDARVHLVAGAADPLEAGRDRLRRLDLHDEVDRAHVDAELERRGGDQRGQTAGLQHLLDLEPLLARDRAVVGAGDVRLGELVQAVGDPLGGAAAVHEDERRAVGADELEQARVDRRPDRLARLAVDRRARRPARACRRPGRRPRGRAACGAPASTISTGRSPRPGSGRSPRAAAASPRARSAAGRRRRGARAARARARGGCRACPPPAAWISSTITVSDAGQHLARRRGQDQVERLRAW